MKKNFKHIVNRIFESLAAVIMAAMILAFIFIVNSYHYFIYALIISALVFILRKTQRKVWKKKGEYFLMLLGFIYVFMLILFSVSPFLRFKEFQVTHLRWNTAESKVVFYQSGWDKPYRKSSGYAYSDITYTYKIGQRSFTRTEHKAEKLYYPVWESKNRIHKLKSEILQRTEQQIAERKFILLYNPGNLSESKLFISTQPLYLQGSGLYAFAVMIGIILLLATFCIIFTQKK
ncbi:MULTISPECIES: hypothetical protein [Chryseobacterium]|uniref:hypothetical protein n=1 Tax=Chryseobacterium TaxID=59732 RepID=UPI001297D3B4|nr:MULTISPECIES: hypothetical protein [Chryseobacterium]MDR6922598.1 energy-coupling factor transporter transmembrane protein EcfT [Chryseobacterium sp. 2987]